MKIDRSVYSNYAFQDEFDYPEICVFILDIEPGLFPSEMHNFNVKLNFNELTGHI